MRLFTKSDLERAARKALYLYEHSQVGEVNGEAAIQEAVREVAGEASEWLHYQDVKELLEAAYHRGQRDCREQRNVTPVEAISDLLP